MKKMLETGLKILGGLALGLGIGIAGKTAYDNFKSKEDQTEIEETELIIEDDNTIEAE